MFINISTNGIYMSDWSKSLFVHQHETFENDNLDRIINFVSQTTSEKVFVVSWPWSFTNIKIWTIILNTIKTVKSSDLDFHFVDKVALYQHILANHDIWYEYIACRIGQKNNYFVVEKDKFYKDSIENIQKNISDQNLVWESLDDISTGIHFDFVDSSSLTLDVNWKKVKIWNNLDMWKIKKLIEAEYMM